jgi:hypothetical protein
LALSAATTRILTVSHSGKLWHWLYAILRQEFYLVREDYFEEWLKSGFGQKLFASLQGGGKVLLSRPAWCVVTGPQHVFFKVIRPGEGFAAKFCNFGISTLTWSSVPLVFDHK